MVGDPAGHSLSPSIHRAGYLAAGLDWSYDSYTVSAKQLDAFVSSCRADPRWAGLSVTAPHKESIIAMGEPDSVVELVKAANTVVFHRDRTTVHNTDVGGFIRAWRANRLGSPERTAIVGCGATARSILLAVQKLGARQVIILARNPDRCAKILSLGERLEIEVRVESLDRVPGSLDLVASTIPAEATRELAAGWAAGAETLFDVVYDPWPTPLGVAGQSAGRHTLNGLDLLAGQAVDQFKLLCGRETTFEACRAAAETELMARAQQ